MHWLRILPIALVASAVAFAWVAKGPAVQAQEDKDKITPEMAAVLDTMTKDVAKWADEKAVVDAVVAQNKVGPIADMTKEKWKEQRRRTPLIDGFQQNDAAKLMAERVKTTEGVVVEAFVSAAQGEKVAFLEKTSSYIHKGSAKFDVPFTTGKPWRGSPDFDESTQSYSLQFSVPVFAPRAEGEGEDVPRKTIGVMTVGVDLEKLAERAKRAAG
ncbi:MAG: hypothetical protein GC161_08475 [Planctomycetaceae bacterium]|nr:hypothetical protein [Planctomycetaceae bacterium]